MALQNILANPKMAEDVTAKGVELPRLDDSTFEMLKDVVRTEGDLVLSGDFKIGQRHVGAMKLPGMGGYLLTDESPWENEPKLVIGYTRVVNIDTEGQVTRVVDGKYAEVQSLQTPTAFTSSGEIVDYVRNLLIEVSKEKE